MSNQTVAEQKNVVSGTLSNEDLCSLVGALVHMKIEPFPYQTIPKVIKCVTQFIPKDATCIWSHCS
jgi:hypothetical protein